MHQVQRVGGNAVVRRAPCVAMFVSSKICLVLLELLKMRAGEGYLLRLTALTVPQ